MYKKTEVLGNIHQRALDYIGDKKSKESYIKYREEFQNAASFKKIYPYPIHVDIEIDIMPQDNVKNKDPQLDLGIELPAF